MDHLKLTKDSISINSIINLATDNSSESMSIFVGKTRENLEGRKVLRLEYEADESVALSSMKVICANVRALWLSIRNIVIYHRLGELQCHDVSVIIAVSSPRQQDTVDALKYCTEQLKAMNIIVKKEFYEDEDGGLKENTDCSPKKRTCLEANSQKNLVRLDVSTEEILSRKKKYHEMKQNNTDVSNIEDFIQSKKSKVEDTDVCARVRSQYQRQIGSKGHFKVYRVNNEWGPQTVRLQSHREQSSHPTNGLPTPIAERMFNVEKFVNISSVSPDVFKRLKDVEDRIAFLESLSPQYSNYWKQNKSNSSVKETTTGTTPACQPKKYIYSPDDIAKEIEILQSRIKQKENIL